MSYAETQADSEASETSTVVNMPLTNSQQEISAMMAISESLAGLDENGVRRVMSWVGDHFGYRLAPPPKPRRKK